MITLLKKGNIGWRDLDDYRSITARQGVKDLGQVPGGAFAVSLPRVCWDLDRRVLSRDE